MLIGFAEDKIVGLQHQIKEAQEADTSRVQHHIEEYEALATLLRSYQRRLESVSQIQDLLVGEIYSVQHPSKQETYQMKTGAAEIADAIAPEMLLEVVRTLKLERDSLRDRVVTLEAENRLLKTMIDEAIQEGRG